MGEPLDRTGLILNENGRLPLKIFDHYETIFYAFYGHTPSISDHTMEDALKESIDLLVIADYLGCNSIISKSIDVALVKHGQDLFRSIQKMPWGWVGLAVSIKSELMFKEAVVHLAGNWRTISRNQEAMIILQQAGKGVRELCERLHESNLAAAMQLELAVMSLYPGDMATPSKQLPIKREHYAKDVLVWMALSFFRHWLGQRIISEQGSQALDGGYELYVQLGMAGEAYMDKSVISQFHSKFPMTKKAMNILETHLLEIKECVKEMVAKHAILESTCMLDTHRYPVDYLTCAVVKKEDLPWREANLESGRKVSLRRGTKRSLDKEIKMTGNEIVRRSREAQNIEIMVEEEMEDDCHSDRYGEERDVEHHEQDEYVSEGERFKKRMKSV
jgi:hypothetical protein